MKIDRLFAITNLLLDKRNITGERLAEMFGVSVRTIYRDIDILSSNGVPVYTVQGKGGGVFLMEGYSIDRAMLSSEEQGQILEALGSMRAVQGGTSDAAITKLRGLFQRRETDWIEIDFAGWEQADAEKERFDLIKGCILRRKTVEFYYYNSKGEETVRIVEPLKLVFKGLSWYLYGFCRLRGDYRFFKILRMGEIKIAQDGFDRMAPEIVKKDYKKKKAEKVVHLQLSVDKSMAFRVFDEFRGGKIETDKEFLLAEVDLPDNEWLINYLLGFGESLEVLGPPEVRELVKSRLHKIYKKYE